MLITFLLDCLTKVLEIFQNFPAQIQINVRSMSPNRDKLAVIS